MELLYKLGFKNVYIVNQCMYLKYLKQEWILICKIDFWCFDSLDSSDGTGDHENYFVSSSLFTDVVGKRDTYKNCEKIAIRVRTVEEGKYWPATDFIILFSYLTEDGRLFDTDPQLNTKEHADVDQKHYSKNINPKYGYVWYIDI